MKSGWNFFSPVEYVAKEVKRQQEIVDQALAEQLEKLEQLRHDESPDKTTANRWTDEKKKENASSQAAKWT